MAPPPVRSEAEIGRRLSAAAHRSDGPRGVVRLLREEFGLGCWVLSPLATVWAAAGGAPGPGEVERVWRHVTGRPGDASTVPLGGGERASVHAIRGGDGRVRGHLVCARAGAAGTRRALRTALRVLGAELDRLERRRAAERQRVGDLLDLVRRPGVPAAAAVAARLRPLGADPALPFVAVAARPDPGLPGALLVGGLLAGRARRVLPAERDGDVIALVNGRLPAGAVEAALRGAPARYGLALAGRPLVAGVSGAVPDAGGLRAAVEDARRALNAARAGAAAGPVTVVPAADTDSHGLLLAAVPEGVRQAYRDRLLGPLEEYDALHGSELVGTLAAFLDACGSWQRAAGLLYVHVNTLRYRVQRIEELTGRDLALARDRTDLYLALRCPS
ncbi:PucR family transcriptional regulator [Actinomadura sp. 21ATH]|uniref:PucR family transcriptional regulator n=1 Tax=Actinomadura sp. 21ATH TaxID=1735444 RepID=UPI0035C08050